MVKAKDRRNPYRDRNGLPPFLCYHLGGDQTTEKIKTRRSWTDDEKSLKIYRQVTYNRLSKNTDVSLPLRLTSDEWGNLFLDFEKREP